MKFKNKLLITFKKIALINPTLIIIQVVTTYSDINVVLTEREQERKGKTLGKALVVTLRQGVEDGAILP